MDGFAKSAPSDIDGVCPPLVDRGRRRSPQSWVARSLEDLVADSELLSQCPQSDRNNVRSIAAQMLMVRLFYWIIMSFALVAAFGNSPTAIYLSVAGAFIPGSLLYGFDLLMVRASFSEHGMRALRKRANFGQRDVAEAAANGIRLALRVALSVLGANVFALFFIMFYSQSSIREQMVLDYRSSHQSRYVDVQENYDNRIAAQVQIIARENSTIQAENSELGVLEKIRLGETDGNSSQLRGEVANLRQKLLQAQMEARTYADRSTCEETGEQCPGATGVAGRRGKYFAAKAHQQNAEALVSSLQQQVDDAERKLADVQAAANHRSDELTRLIGESQARLDAATLSVQGLRSQRDSAIDSEVQRLEPMSDGPFVQLNALYQLARHSEAASRLWVSLELLIIALELTAIIAAFSIDPKGVYPILLAERHERAATEASRRLVMHSTRCEAEIVEEVARLRRDPADFESAGGSVPPEPPSPPAPAHATRLEEASYPASEVRPQELAASVVPDGTGKAAHLDEELTPQSSVRPGVPFMITQSQKERLRSRGYSNEEIARMPPSVAHAILASSSDNTAVS